MLPRPIHPRPFVLPRGVTLPPLPLEDVSHTPGQAAAIRFFNHHSAEDLEAMREILSGKQVKKWMDDPGRISRADYEDWAGTHTPSSFLFAVMDARATTRQELERVRGFVYIYSEREEKFRVRRMEKLGFLEPCEDKCHLLEVSFAARPLVDGQQLGSGLMSSALRQSCLQVQMLLNMPVKLRVRGSDKTNVKIFAFVDPENLPAQRTLEASGFVKKGSMKYDWDSPEPTLLYMLDWRLLGQKVRTKLLEELRKAR